MSADAIWERVRRAWALLASRPERSAAGGRRRAVRSGRQREERPQPRGDEPTSSLDGFVDEALPWMDAVYRFALRLVRGDQDAAEDLLQETYLRAHRFWDSYERGSNVKSWLFTICRNTHLHQLGTARSRRERTESQLDGVHGDVASFRGDRPVGPDPERTFFDHVIDESVVQAIDGLPDEFRDVLVLSDLGDLQYREIAEVLEIPIGTVRSRLSRARRLLRSSLRDYAVHAGYIEGT